MVEAIQRQAEQLLHYSASDFYLPIYSDVCEELDRIAPFGEDARSFLTNSGTEAVEGAIKLARFATGRQYVIAMLGSFHGRSYGSVAHREQGRGTGRVRAAAPGVVHTPFGDFEHLEQVVFKRLVPAEEVAAIVVEPILGEGGYVLPPDGWLRVPARALRPARDPARGRRGPVGHGTDRKMWAIEHFGVEPMHRARRQGDRERDAARRADRARTPDDVDVGAHGSTCGGNPLSCAAALATLELIEGGLMDNAREVGGVLLDGLRRSRPGGPRSARSGWA